MANLGEMFSKQREKPKATSAATTAFCGTEIPITGTGGAGVLTIWIDGNGKITAGNGTLDNPKPNAFSLVQIEDCPGATETCKKSCYVHGLQKHAPETHKLYQHNSRVIRQILSDEKDARLAERIMGDWIAKNCEGGFRWHVSGDVFSHAYAQFIVWVCRHSPGVNHWIYTRSLQYVPTLYAQSTRVGGNLALNISCDKDNWDDARDLVVRYGARPCFMVTEAKQPIPALPEGAVIFPDYNLRGGNQAGMDWFDALPSAQKRMVCPVDYHGKAENRRCGPCSRCLF